MVGSRLRSRETRIRSPTPAQHRSTLANPPIRHPLLPWAMLALGLTMSPEPVTAQTPSFGPLVAGEGGPLQRISYTPMSERADPVDRGTLATELWVGYSNIFEEDSAATHELLLDMEQLIKVVSIRYEMAAGWEVGGRVTLETTGGGYLDSFITWLHTKLSLGNANRERYPEDGHHVRLRVPGGETFLDTGPRTLALGDVRLFVKWRAASNDDGSSALSLRAATRIPVHNDQVGGERTDLALMALGHLPLGHWHVHGMVGGATVRASPELDPILHNTTTFGMLGVEHALSNQLAGIVQYMWSSSLLTGFGGTQDRPLVRKPGVGRGGPDRRALAVAGEPPGGCPVGHARGGLHAWPRVESSMGEPFPEVVSPSPWWVPSGLPLTHGATLPILQGGDRQGYPDGCPRERPRGSRHGLRQSLGT